MSIVNNSNLERYAGKQKEWATNRYMSSVYSNYQLTEKAKEVSFYPVGDSPLEGTVDFMFTEVPPVTGEKSPYNISTIVGVNSIDVNVRDVNDIVGKNYTIDLGGTYYGGSINFATGLMTVTWINKILDRQSLALAEAGYTWDSAAGKRSKRLFMKLDGTVSGLLKIKNISNITSNYFNLLSQPITYDDQVFGTMWVQPGAGTWLMFYDDDEVVTSASNTVYQNREIFVDWFEAKKTNGNPVTITYELDTPQTVQLTIPQIYSLIQQDKYTPKLNTAYSTGTSVQVGYRKSPIREEYEIQQAIASLGGV